MSLNMSFYLELSELIWTECHFHSSFLCSKYVILSWYIITSATTLFLWGELEFEFFAFEEVKPFMVQWQ